LILVLFHEINVKLIPFFSIVAAVVLGFPDVTLGVVVVAVVHAATFGTFGTFRDAPVHHSVHHHSFASDSLFGFPRATIRIRTWTHRNIASSTPSSDEKEQ
jgi:hypothetical protein